jgi:uncharacterized alkaline shock family protein YloU
MTAQSIPPERGPGFSPDLNPSEVPGVVPSSIPGIVPAVGPDGTVGSPDITVDGPAGLTQGEAEDVTETIARAVLGHPGVVRLDGGRFGEFISPLPGRRVVGVRVGTAEEGVELGVVLRLGQPIPVVAQDLREIVRDVLGPVPVDVSVVDVITGAVGGP